MYQATYLQHANRWVVTHALYGFVLGQWEHQQVAEDIAAMLNGMPSGCRPGSYVSVSEG